MNGTVVRLRPNGVEANMDSATNSLTDANQFQVYRVVDGNEVIVGTGFAKRSRGPNLICINPLDNTEFNAPQVGDLVRSV